jgi:hypothetical protein
MKYYEAINKTSTEIAPWCVVPADDKDMCRYIIAEMEWDAKYTDIKEPELDDKIKMNFSMYKDQLAKE